MRHQRFGEGGGLTGSFVTIDPFLRRKKSLLGYRIGTTRYLGRWMYVNIERQGLKVEHKHARDQKTWGLVPNQNKKQHKFG